MDKSVPWTKFECEYGPFLIFWDDTLFVNDDKTEYNIKYSDISNIELWIKTRSFVNHFYRLYVQFIWPISGVLLYWILTPILSLSYVISIIYIWLFIIGWIIWFIFIRRANKNGKLNWLIFQRRYLKIFLKNWETVQLNYLNLSVTEYLLFCDILEHKWIELDIINGGLSMFKQLWKCRAINVLNEKNIVDKHQVVIYEKKKEDLSTDLESANTNDDKNIVNDLDRYSKNVKNIENGTFEKNIKSDISTQNNIENKKWYMMCPFCANRIKKWAIKCQYCREFLDEENIKNKINAYSKNSNY